MSEITKAVANIMGAVGSIKKEGTNQFHNYKFAAAADVLHKLQPLMAKEGLIVLQSETERSLIDSGNVLQIGYAFTLLHKNGETWPEKIIRTGMSAARNTKGGFDDKAVNKCHTSAHKYFLITLFEIPTGDYHDADADEDRGISAKITPVQAEEITRLANEKFVPCKVIYEACGVGSINDIPADRFNGVMKTLGKKGAAS